MPYLDVRIRLCAEQHVQNLQMVKRAREGDGRVALIIHRVALGARPDQHLRHLAVAYIRRLDQGGLAGDVVAHVDLAAGVHEHLGHVEKAVIRRAVERAVAIAIDCVHISSRVEQQPRDVYVAVPRGQNQRRVAIMV